MSIITKAIATEVAIKLTSKQWKEIESLESKLEKQFEEVYLKSIPLDVQDAFEKYPGYFNTTKYVQVSGNGFNYQNLQLTKILPKIKGGFRLKEKDAVTLLKKYNEIEDKKSEARKLLQEIEVVLNSLRSYKKINSEFPEATPFLPEKITTQLAVNISDVQSKLK